MKRAYTVRFKVNSEMKAEDQVEISFDSTEVIGLSQQGVKSSRVHAVY